MRRMFGASFVGRSAELDEVRALVAERALVSLVGEGGMGKTRLAAEVASLEQSRGGRVVWVDLAATRTPPNVVDAVVDSLPAGADATGLEGLLRARLPSGLLVLDNCEHVAAAVVDLLESLDRVCPGVHVLATSRERLGLAGEVTYRLGPLGVPAPDAVVDEALRSPAVQLLADRMRDRVGDFRVDERNVTSLVTLSRYVEGSPLGIELVAARAGSLPLGALAELLPGPLRRPSDAYRGGPQRHRSMDANVLWSIDLLSTPGRLMLQFLSVFAHSFTLGTARPLLDAEDGLRSCSVEGLISELVEASVVRVLGEGRYRLPAAVRSVARDALAQEGHEVLARDLHAESVQALVIGESEALRVVDQPAWLVLIDAELPEIRAAMDWSVHRGRPEQAAAILLATTDHWYIRSRFAEATRRSEALLAIPELDPASRAALAGTSPLLALSAGRLADGYRLADQALRSPALAGRWRAYALANRAWCGFHTGLGSDTQIWADVDQAAQTARSIGDTELQVEADIRRGSLTTLTRSIPEGSRILAETVARCPSVCRQSVTGLVFQAYGPVVMDLKLDHRLAIAREALRSARMLAHPAHTVMALSAIGTIATLRGDRDSAEHHVNEAVALAGDHDLPTYANIAQRWRAFLHYRFDLHDTAAQAEHSIRRARQTSNEWDAAAGLWLLGLTRLRDGDDEGAAIVLQESWQTSADPGYPFTRLRSALGLAIVDLRRDRYRDALTGVHDAIAIATETGDRWGVTAALDHLALLECLRGAHEHSGKLLGAADAILSTAGVTRLPFEAALRVETTERMAQALGDRLAQDAITTGQSLSEENALRLARRSRGARKRPTTGWESLTPSERDVVRLAASGLTTQQIADSLTVSANTVKTHLSHVYTKLDITSRAQLAAVHSEQAHLRQESTPRPGTP